MRDDPEKTIGGWTSSEYISKVCDKCGVGYILHPKVDIHYCRRLDGQVIFDSERFWREAAIVASMELK